MSLEEVLSIARTGAAQGCTEALFTLGKGSYAPLAVVLKFRKSSAYPFPGYMGCVARGLCREDALKPYSPLVRRHIC